MARHGLPATPDRWATCGGGGARNIARAARRQVAETRALRLIRMKWSAISAGADVLIRLSATPCRSVAFAQVVLFKRAARLHFRRRTRCTARNPFGHEFGT